MEGTKRLYPIFERLTREVTAATRSVRGDIEPAGRSAERCRRRVLLSLARQMWEVRGLPVRGRDSVVDRLVRRATSTDLADFLGEPDALSQALQAMNAPALASAYRETARSRRKFTAAEIPAVTQLFTPLWVAEWLVQNTLGRAWLDLHPDSALAPQMRWLARFDAPSGPHPGPATVRRVAEMTFLDPACGTMNIGIAAADLFKLMYREEQEKAGRNGWPAEPSASNDASVACSILSRNLFGADIDPFVLRLARVAIGAHLGIGAAASASNLIVADALRSSPLPRHGARPAHFDVIVTNPPYLAARNLPQDMVRELKQLYPRGRADGCGCFIDRCIDLLSDGGRMGLLSMQTFMFTSSFEALRQRLAEATAVEAIAHFGPGLFGVGNPGTLQTVAFTARRSRSPDQCADQEIDIFRLVDEPGPGAKRRRLEQMLAADGSEPPAGRFRVRQGSFAALPRSAWPYWLEKAERDAFQRLPRLKAIAPPRQGLATTDNSRFVRYWWEVTTVGVEPTAVATEGRWRPYVKGGRFRRWHESPRHRVNWEADGREIKAEIVRRYPYLNGAWEWVAKNAAYYGREGVTYSYLTSGRFSARRLDAGAIFDVAGSALFPPDGRAALGLLAALNSSAAERLLRAINPTVNFQVGDVAELPVPQTFSDALCDGVAEAIQIQRELDARDETTPEFSRPLPWADARDWIESRRDRLARLERGIDAEMTALYRVAPGPPCPATPAAMEVEAAERARRWASYVIGLELGRWRGDGSGPCLEPIRLWPAAPALLRRLRERIDGAGGPGAVEGVDRAIGGLARFLAREFFTWHQRLYRQRPIYWALSSGDAGWLLRHDRATGRTVRSVLKKLGAEAPAGWERCADDGALVNYAPLAEFVPDAEFRRVLKRCSVDMAAGGYGWSKTASTLA